MIGVSVDATEGGPRRVTVEEAIEKERGTMMVSVSFQEGFDFRENWLRIVDNDERYSYYTSYKGGI